MKFEKLFRTPDGVTHESEAAAEAHMRRPKILEALNAITQDNTELSEWLLENKEDIVGCLDTGTIRRVTKAERKKLKVACDRVKELYASGEKALAFLAENADDLVETFRYPTTTRMTEEEKANAIRMSVLAISEGNEDLARFVAEHRAQILEAYEAGKIKREVSPKAKDALAAYRAAKAAEKAAKAQESAE